MDQTERWLLEAKQELDAKNAARLAETNAALPTFAPKEPRFIPENLTAYGYTMKSGPLAGRVAIATGRPGTEDQAAYEQFLPNTMAHEGHHQRVFEQGHPPYDVPGHLSPAWRQEALGNRMREIQPTTEGGPYWGIAPSATPEEQIASLKGYEGSLPKGTAITETPVGQRLFDTQPLKDYYFGQISHPYGGLWEGQTPEPGYGEMLTRAIKEFLWKRGVMLGSPALESSEPERN